MSRYFGVAMESKEIRHCIKRVEDKIEADRKLISTPVTRPASKGVRSPLEARRLQHVPHRKILLFFLREGRTMEANINLAERRRRTTSLLQTMSHMHTVYLRVGTTVI